MKEFPITFLRREGGDRAVMNTNRGIFLFSIPQTRSLSNQLLSRAKRMLFGPRLASLEGVPMASDAGQTINVYEYFDRALVRCILKAQSASLQHGHRQITSVHLLNSLLHDEFVMNFFTKRLLITVEHLSHMIARELAVDTDEDIARLALRAAGNAAARGSASVCVSDMLLAMIEADRFTRSILESAKFEDRDIKNIVNWMRLSDSASGLSRTSIMSPRLRGPLWGSVIDTREAPYIVGRESVVTEVLLALNRGAFGIMMHAEKGAGIDGALCAIADILSKGKQRKPMIQIEISELCRGVSSSVARDRLQEAIMHAKQMNASAVVIRGMEEYIGMAGAHGFDLSSAIFALIQKKVVPLIIVMDYQSSQELKKHQDYPNMAEVTLLSLSDNEKILMILSHVCDIENRHNVILSYPAIKRWVVSVPEHRPSHALAKLHDTLKAVPAELKHKPLNEDEITQALIHTV